MASSIGDDVSTWGALRCTLGNQAQDYVAGANNVEYNSGFKTTEGNGLLRTTPDIRSLFYYQPFFVYTGATFYMENSYLYGMLTQEDKDELIGEEVDVTSGSGTFTINSDAFDLVGGQSSTVGGSAPIISIGKLTAF